MAKGYEELTERVERLNSLLKNPKEGLFTWNEFVHVHWQRITELWSGEHGRTHHIECPHCGKDYTEEFITVSAKMYFYFNSTMTKKCTSCEKIFEVQGHVSLDYVISRKKENKLNSKEIILRALAENSLLDALCFVAAVENDRAVEQALRNTKEGIIKPDGSLWETCFKTLFEAVLDGWEEKMRMLRSKGKNEKGEVENI